LPPQASHPGTATDHWLLAHAVRKPAEPPFNP